MTERCVICGEEIPEGRMVCPICEGKKVPLYIGTVKVDGKEVRSEIGTIQQLAIWAENNIRCRGKCEIDIKKIPE